MVRGRVQVTEDEPDIGRSWAKIHWTYIAILLHVMCCWQAATAWRAWDLRRVLHLPHFTHNFIRHKRQEQ